MFITALVSCGEDSRAVLKGSPFSVKCSWLLLDWVYCYVLYFLSLFFLLLLFALVHPISTSNFHFQNNTESSYFACCLFKVSFRVFHVFSMFVILSHLYLERKEVFAEFSFRLVLNLILVSCILHLTFQKCWEGPWGWMFLYSANRVLLKFGSQLGHLLFFVLTLQSYSGFLFPEDFKCCNIS